jgi:hypothetical protein
MKQVILTSILFIACCSAAFAQSAPPQCPKILIYVTRDLAEPGSTVQFFADVENYFGPDKLEYEWVMSGDLKLISGEKSRLMQARRTGDDAGTVTVTVTPFPAGCENHRTESTPPIDRPELELIDEFQTVYPGTRKANLDNFFIRLIDNPGSRGLIVITKGKGALGLARTLVKHMGFLKKDMSLVSLVFASEPGDTTQFWLIPPGALEPKYVDAVYVRTKDFVNLERIFKPAKTVRKKTK